MPIVNFKLDAQDREMNASVKLPDHPCRPVDVMPAILPLTSAIVGIYEARAVEQNQPIPCRAGCAACCRQLVPVSEPEALHLSRVVASMPLDIQTMIRKRFAEAREKAAPVLERFHQASGEDAVTELGKAASAYFALKIDCPFLENESCGIHLARPSVCREYIVTSDPIHCATLDTEKVIGVEIPNKASSTLIYFQNGDRAEHPSVLALIDSLHWADGNPQQPPPRPAVELFQNFVKDLLEEPLG